MSGLRHMKNLLGGLSIALWEGGQLSRRTMEIQLNNNILPGGWKTEKDAIEVSLLVRVVFKSML